MGQPGRQRLPGRGRQGHHALFAALATHQQHPRIAARGRNWQRHQFADAHAGGVKHLDQAGVAQPVGLVAPGLACRIQQARYLVLAQGFGQAFRAPGPGDLDGWIIAAPAFLDRKAEHLLDRRQAARAGAGGQPLGLTVQQIALDIIACCVGKTALWGQKGGKIQQIAPIGQLGVGGGALFGRSCIKIG